jgi:hypothetical protein
MDMCTWALFDELVCLFLMGGRTLRAFYLSALWPIYETMYLFLRVKEYRFISPSHGAGLIVLPMGDGILTHLSLRFLDPIVPPISSLQIRCLKYLLAIIQWMSC